MDRDDKKKMPIFVKYGIAALALIVVIAVGLIIYFSSTGGYVATIGGEKVGTGEFKYYLNYQKAYMLNTAKQDAPNIDEKTFWNTKINGENALAVAKKRTMDYIKDIKVQLSKAKAAKISLTADEIKSIDDSINTQIIQQYGQGNKTKANQALLQQFGTSLDEIRNMFIEYSIVQKFQKSEMDKTKVSQSDIKTYYDKNPDWYKESSMRTAGAEAAWTRAILISVAQGATQADKDKAKKKAEDLLAQAKAGADFAKLAKDNSEDPGSAQYGGDYIFMRGQMVKEYEDAAFSMSPGQIYDTPILTTYGYFVMKLEDKYAKDQPVSLRAATEFRDYGTTYIQSKLYQQKEEGWKKEPQYNEALNTKVYNSIS